ncbi:MAG: class I SAM-dependent methyltransferase [Deltaproteobacteria bacterium]
MATAQLNLFSAVKYYRKLSRELQENLAKNPNDWPKFQEIFNHSVDKVYDDIRTFEKDNIDKFEDRVYKLKKIFEKRYRNAFLYGEFIKWSYEKPYKYAGDFKIIDEIYRNSPRTTGFDRLWDNYFQQLAAPIAIRERKDDFKIIILDFVKLHKNKDLRIMNLASGPAREIKELLEGDKDKIFSKVVFDCYDFDMNAIEYARQLLNHSANVNFIQKNAIRIALKKDIRKEIPQTYDLIYSTGLFDYFDERIASMLIGNLKKILNKGGLMAISTARSKYHNASACWMEWVAEWNLIYRTEAEFRKIFLNAGFPAQDLQIFPQRSKVMQYCLAVLR